MSTLCQLGFPWSPCATMGTLVAAATAGIGLAFLLALPVLLPLLFDLFATGSAPVWVVTVAVFATGFVHLRPRWSPASAEAGVNAAVRAGAEVLVTAAAGAIINLVPGCGLIPPSATMPEATTLVVLYGLAVVAAFTIGVLLLILCFNRQIPATVSDSTIEVMKLFAVMLMALNLLLSLALIFCA